MSCDINGGGHNYSIEFRTDYGNTIISAEVLVLISKFTIINRQKPMGNFSFKITINRHEISSPIYIDVFSETLEQDIKKILLIS